MGDDLKGFLVVMGFFILIVPIYIGMFVFLNDYFKLKQEVKQLKRNVVSLEEEHGVFKGSEKDVVK